MKEYILLSQSPFYLNIPVTIFFKDSRYRINHRENGKPAAIWADGLVYYCKNGRIIKRVDNRINTDP